MRAGTIKEKTYRITIRKTKKKTIMCETELMLQSGFKLTKRKINQLVKNGGNKLTKFEYIGLR